MRKLIRAMAGLLSAGVSVLLTLTFAVQAALPPDFYIDDDGQFYISSKLSITAVRADQSVSTTIYSRSGDVYNLNIHPFGSAPEAAAVQTSSRKMVVPGGTPFGIKMFTDGIMIVGMSDIQQGIGSINPAKDAGLKVGDILISIDGNKLARNEDVAHYVSGSSGEQVTITLLRGGALMEVYLQPAKTEYDGRYKAGIWVRDSSAGIGTLTYYDPNNMSFAGLGHAVCDVDTGKIMPLSTGEIVAVNISGASAGLSGKPGELRGVFSDSNPIGRLTINSESGIFGRLDYAPGYSVPVPMAYKHEVTPGPATILSTISGSHPQEFDIVIEKLAQMETGTTKNMVIRVIDPRLLASTGGIVQGMSGSPILQNGMLAGAVTHVFVNDPTRGYAIFAENMDNRMRQVELSGTVA